jgi:3-oxoacyl-[acyl-carrier protein] reductase
MSLEGKVALVTGASGGIGKAIALELALQKAKIGIHYHRNEKSALEVVEEIQKQGGEAIPLQASIAEEVQVAEMCKRLGERFGKLDILVSNAGITKDYPLLRMKVEDFDSVIHTNLRGTFLCFKEAGRLMLKNKYGRIVAISSIVGLTGNIGQANYAASKAGIIALTKTFAREMARWDITANVVAPGAVAAGMYQGLNEEIQKKVLSLIPKERFAEPQEVAKLVTFLVTDDARYITGQVFSINGGMLM